MAIRMETDEGVCARNEQTLETANDIWSSLYPLINSMRAFGVYFTRKPRVAPATTSQLSCQETKGYPGWNRAQVYGTIMFTVTWLNAARSCAIFYGNERLGALLFIKLGTIPGVLLIAFLHTTYYVASHNGSLERVFRQMNFSAYDFSRKFSRRAKVVTVVAWLLTALGIGYYIYIAFAKEHFNDFWLIMIITTFDLSKTHADILKVLSVILQLQAIACWAFTQAMKYHIEHCLFPIFHHFSFHRTFPCICTL